MGGHIRVIFLSMGKQRQPAEPMADIPPGFAGPRGSKAKNSVGGKPPSANPPTMRKTMQGNGRVTSRVGVKPTGATTVTPTGANPSGEGLTRTDPSEAGPSNAPETVVQDKAGPSTQSGLASPEVSLPTPS
ncbi:unnamed protein product [Calypogeia fissa]